MTNPAFIYHRPSKWPIATALDAAVLIHLSAVAIAFHRDSPAALDFVELFPPSAAGVSNRVPQLSYEFRLHFS